MRLNISTCVHFNFFFLKSFSISFYFFSFFSITIYPPRPSSSSTRPRSPKSPRCGPRPRALSLSFLAFLFRFWFLLMNQLDYQAEQRQTPRRRAGGQPGWGGGAGGLEGAKSHLKDLPQFNSATLSEVSPVTGTERGAEDRKLMRHRPHRPGPRSLLEKLIPNCSGRGCAGAGVPCEGPPLRAGRCPGLAGGMQPLSVQPGSDK